MIQVENLTTPSPEWWKTAIHGMRNAFKSWDKGDSGICRDSDTEEEICYDDCPFVDHWEGEAPYSIPVCYYDTYKSGPVFVLGKNDKKLFLGLTAEGDPSHRKVLRQLPVIMDITAPLYWWKQMDQYKVGTVTNSESTMHTITKSPFTLDDFSLEHFKQLDGIELPRSLAEAMFGFNAMDGEECFENTVISLLNDLRDEYLDTKDKESWYALNEFLPQSYNQKRTWSANYEVLLTIMAQRIDHKLSEWNELIICWLKEVPYLLDLAVAAEIVDMIDEAVICWDKKYPDEYHTLYRVD